jgi:hypothetical protein
VPILVAAVRFLVVLFIVRLGVRLFVAARQRPDPGPGRPATDLVRDHVCNTFVPRDRAVAGMVAGRTEHFCSADCLQRAQDALDSQAAAVQSHARNGGAGPERARPGRQHG